VARMLAERLAVIAEHDPGGAAIEAARLQPAAQRAQRGGAVEQRAAIAAELVVIGKRAALRRFAGMMTGNRQVGHEERPIALRVDPAQEARPRRRARARA